MMTNEMFTRDFTKALFAGEKRLMKLKEVNFISTPKYDEISVKKLYPILIEMEGMKQYFPDKYSKGRQCDHDYLFNIANTLHPKTVKESIEYAHSQRFDVKEDK